jgi:hypothetical protein
MILGLIMNGIDLRNDFVSVSECEQRFFSDIFVTFQRHRLENF